MKDINEWYADKCGIEITDFGWICNSAKKAGNGKFRIEECPCREIIREVFEIDTLKNPRPKDKSGGWMAYCFNPFVERGGKTIANAEVACLEAIYKTEKES